MKRLIVYVLTIICTTVINTLFAQENRINELSQTYNYAEARIILRDSLWLNNELWKKAIGDIKRGKEKSYFKNKETAEQVNIVTIPVLQISELCNEPIFQLDTNLYFGIVFDKGIIIGTLRAFKDDNLSGELHPFPKGNIDEPILRNFYNENKNHIFYDGVTLSLLVYDDELKLFNFPAGRNKQFYNYCEYVNKHHFINGDSIYASRFIDKKSRIFLPSYSYIYNKVFSFVHGYKTSESSEILRQIWLENQLWKDVPNYIKNDDEAKSVEIKSIPAITAIWNENKVENVVLDSNRFIGLFYKGSTLVAEIDCILDFTKDTTLLNKSITPNIKENRKQLGNLSIVHREAGNTMYYDDIIGFYCIIKNDNIIVNDTYDGDCKPYLEFIKERDYIIKE